MFFWSKKKKEEKHRRLVILAFVENELSSMLRPFPKVRLKVRHEKEQSTFMIHQNREEGEEDLYSFAWMRIVWELRERMEFSTREIHPEIRTCSISKVYDVIHEVVLFLEKYNTPKVFAMIVGE